jgi:hypothetical protein
MMVGNLPGVIAMTVSFPAACGAFVLAFAAFPATAQTLPSPGGDGDARPKRPGGHWEVRYIDDSTMKLSLLDDSLTLATPYGPLHIPFREIRRIEFGTRWNDADQARLDQALADVLGKDTAKRESGKAALLELGMRAVPAIQRALKSAQPDAKPHLDDVAAKLQRWHGNPKTETRDYDLVVTDESRIAGRVQAPAFRIETFQFGELKLKLADVAVLALAGDTDGEKLEIVEEKRIYELLVSHMGKTVGLRTTGAIQGAVWGTGPFTGDSDLATAAVFAGVLKVGQAGIVKVKLVPSPASFQGGNANGVTTSAYGQYPAGAYEIVVK